MMSTHRSGSAFFLLNVAAYLTLVTVAMPVLAAVPGRSRLWVGLLFALFGVLATLFHRLKPGGVWIHAYLAAQTAILMALIIDFPESGVSHVHLLFFVLSAYAMLMLPLLPAVAWIVAFFALTMAAATYFFGWKHAVGMSAVAGGHALFGGFGALLRRSEMDRQRTEALLAELREAHRQLQEYATRVEQLAVAEERNRLAREMHDALGHRLTVAVVQLEGAQRLIPTDPQRAARIVSTMREQLKTALGELRQTVAALRAAPENELPLPAALSRLTQSFRDATGLAVHLDLPPELPPLPAGHHLALYRAAQEGLTNVQRHAKASQAWLALRADNGHVFLTVADDGRNFPAAIDESAFGLRGLRERAAELGGQLLLEDRPGGGAQIRLELPLLPEKFPKGRTHQVE
jgi:signal transduction histidine kinase